jgi:hypothetical protein
MTKLTIGQRVRITNGGPYHGHLGTVRSVNSRGDVAVVWVEPDIGSRPFNAHEVEDADSTITAYTGSVTGTLADAKPVVLRRK